MNKNTADYASLLVRLSMCFVILWFGINQLVNPADFMGYLPEFLLTSGYAGTIIFFNGVFEIIFGTLLLIGLFTRIASFLLGIHLFFIVLGLGYNDIAVRDFALMLATFAITIRGEDQWCLDYRRKKT